MTPGSGRFSTADKYEHDRITQKIGQGWIGQVFGSSEEKAGNIAAVIITIGALCLAGLTVVAMLTANIDLIDKSLSIVGAVILTTVGYVFGKKT